MKVKPEHYAVLRDALRPLVTSKAFADYRERLKEDGIKDPEMRARWDALWAVSSDLPPNFISGVLYAYCDDSHVDTALRAIVKELTTN